MRRALVALVLVACGDRAAPLDAPDVNACCELGPELAPACIGAELPPGTCAAFRCPMFDGDACGAPKVCHCAPPPPTSPISICGC